MSRLLLDEKPLMVLPRLATAIGLNEAIVLQQVHYWLVGYREAEEGLPKKEQRHFRQGRWWVYNSLSDWRTNFPFWSKRTIHRAINALKCAGEASMKGADAKVQRDPLLIVLNFNTKTFDRTLWYTINYDGLSDFEAALGGACPTDPNAPEWRLPKKQIEFQTLCAVGKRHMVYNSKEEFDRMQEIIARLESGELPQEFWDNRLYCAPVHHWSLTELLNWTLGPDNLERWRERQRQGESTK